MLYIVADNRFDKRCFSGVSEALHYRTLFRQFFNCSSLARVASWSFNFSLVLVKRAFTLCRYGIVCYLGITVDVSTCIYLSI